MIRTDQNTSGIDRLRMHRQDHMRTFGKRVAMICVSLCVLLSALHWVALWSGSGLWGAVSARLFYLVILYGAIEGGLVMGLLVSLCAGGGLLVAMSLHFSGAPAVMFTTHLEHYSEIPFFLLTGITAGFLMDHVIHERAKARETESLFSRYVSPSVVERILRDGAELRGEEIRVTVLFADIRGFTSLSENMRPGEVMHLLNTFFTEMADVLLAHDALLDKYIGDAVMAVFGAPIPRGDDAHRAVIAAIEMIRRLETLNAAGVFNPPLAMGIGIHTGTAVAGSVGCPRKMEYTVLGDTVNLAYRMQSLTRTYDAPLLLSGASVEAAGNVPGVHFTEIGTTQVKGRSGGVEVYSCAIDPGWPIGGNNNPK